MLICQKETLVSLKEVNVEEEQIKKGTKKKYPGECCCFTCQKTSKRTIRKILLLHENRNLQDTQCGKSSTHCVLILIISIKVGFAATRI
jgi:hypothetical protein